ncbi:MAG TPA: hypothetical protein VLA82_04245 [Actinomycetota bacterium]|nr:hypothetical protein [Actinomycetota bacterium]
MVGADVDMMVFRILHVVSGVMWAGSVFLFVMFVRPSAAAIAPAGAPFMAELLGRRRLVHWLLSFAAVTILAGAYLYWKDWDATGSFGDWIGTGFGLGLTVGAVAAIAAFTIGLVGTRPAVDRMLALGREVAASGGPPTPEQAAELAAIQASQQRLSTASLSLIGVAVVAMAIARYL